MVMERWLEGKGKKVDLELAMCHSDIRGEE
jgi:hypothetical protein